MGRAGVSTTSTLHELGGADTDTGKAWAAWDEAGNEKSLSCDAKRSRQKFTIEGPTAGAKKHDKRARSGQRPDGQTTASFDGVASATSNDKRKEQPAADPNPPQPLLCGAAGARGR